MEKIEIIENLTKRTGGDIYFGVVGGVRTGKSTFIKKVIENLVVPNIEDEYERKRALDEIPQTAQGKTIMTIEPKFVPSNAASICIDNFKTNVRLVDCVGYVVDGCKGYEDEEGPRMVKTPWVFINKWYPNKKMLYLIKESVDYNNYDYMCDIKDLINNVKSRKVKNILLKNTQNH